jgi:hypothetical protein
VREDATDKNAISPGPLAPAHELLGDMLLELKQPAAALAEYQTVLKKSRAGSAPSTVSPTLRNSQAMPRRRARRSRTW